MRCSSGAADASINTAVNPLFAGCEATYCSNCFCTVAIYVQNRHKQVNL